MIRGDTVRTQRSARRLLGPDASHAFDHFASIWCCQTTVFARICQRLGLLRCPLDMLCASFMRFQRTHRELLLFGPDADYFSDEVMAELNARYHQLSHAILHSPTRVLNAHRSYSPTNAAFEENVAAFLAAGQLDVRALANDDIDVLAELDIAPPSPPASTATGIDIDSVIYRTLDIPPSPPADAGTVNDPILLDDDDLLSFMPSRSESPRTPPFSPIIDPIDFGLPEDWPAETPPPSPMLWPPTPPITPPPTPLRVPSTPRARNRPTPY